LSFVEKGKRKRGNENRKRKRKRRRGGKKEMKSERKRKNERKNERENEGRTYQQGLWSLLPTLYDPFIYVHCDHLCNPTVRL